MKYKDYFKNDYLVKVRMMTAKDQRQLELSVIAPNWTIAEEMVLSQQSILTEQYGEPVSLMLTAPITRRDEYVMATDRMITVLDNDEVTK